MENLKKAFWYIFIPFIILLFFRNPLESTLSNFIVKPFLSKIKPSFWLYDLSIISVFIISIFLGYKKIKRGARIPNSWMLIYSSYLIIYIWFRYYNYPFSFSFLSFQKEIKLLDLLNGIPLILIIIDFSKKIKQQREQPLNFIEKNPKIEDAITKKLEEEDKETVIQGFAVDEPITINKDYDILNRIKFIENLSQMILKTESKSGSFPIGIVAPWGSGKTTFIRALKEELENDLLIIELDVWICKSTDQIIESFFELLKKKLKPYSFTINNKIRDYSKSLMSSSGNAIIDSLSKTFFSNKTVEQQYEQLKLEIEKIDKKVVVIIDDIDRLDKREIYEIIRLIRNTANFSNIFFIVAYDRNYILNAIEAINTYNPHTFLEKVFQVEFILPPIGDESLKLEIQNKIIPILSNMDKLEFENFNKNDLQYSFNRVDLTTSFISNIRDVIRFVNSFKINYQFIRGEICFEDFYNLQLIRLKHPEIYIEFYKNQSLFIKLDTRENYHPKKFTYALRMKDRDQNKNKDAEIILKSHLQNQKSVYKINDNEIEIITQSFLKLFPPHNSYSHPRNDANFLSVIQPSMFDRYFVLGIEGKLSVVEFSKARNSKLDLFISQVLEWGKNKNIEDDLIKYFLEINDFDNIEDFEKIIKAFFALGEILSFDLSYLQRMFLKEENKVLALYYENDIEKFRKFFLGLFGNAKSPFLFPARLIRFLDKSYYEPGLYVIKHKELNDFSIQYLEIYCSKIEKIDREVWELFWDCERSNYHNRSSTSEMPGKAKEIMKNFILTKDLDTYLIGSIKDEPFNHKKFNISSTILTLFDSWEKFEIILNQQDEEKWKALKEFKKFFIEVKKSTFSSFIDFQFAEIKLKSAKILKL